MRLIMVELLLAEEQVQVDACTAQGERALHYAIRLNREGMFFFVIDVGFSNSLSDVNFSAFLYERFGHNIVSSWCFDECKTWV